MGAQGEGEAANVRHGVKDLHRRFSFASFHKEATSRTWKKTYICTEMFNSACNIESKSQRPFRLPLRFAATKMV